jgi:tryptophan synthase alpha chain
MSRFTRTFERLKSEGRTGLVTYITAGDPSLVRTRELLPALVRAGADVIEIGVPFSEPLADGPVIQRATERALKAGATLDKVLTVVEEVRPSIDVPLVLFTYVNPVARMGFERFTARAARAGIDGVLTLDLPIEESDEFRGLLDKAGLDTIFLLSPTTTPERLARAAALGRGFLYGISRLGVTGARSTLPPDLPATVARLRKAAALPICVGFGVSTPDQAKAVAKLADGVVVGSALVKAAEKSVADAVTLMKDMRHAIDAA